MENRALRVMMALTFAWVSMVVMALTAPLAMAVGSQWTALTIAGMLMIAAIPVHRLARGRETDRCRSWLWVLCTLMNAVANGFAAAAFYLHGGRMVSAGQLLQGMMPPMVLLALTAGLLTLTHRGRKAVLWMGGLLLAALMAASWIPAAWPVQPQRSAMFLGALAACFHLVAQGRITGREERAALREISLCSFGAAALVGLVVLVIISEGDALDGLDGIDLSGVGQRRRNRPQG